MYEAEGEYKFDNPDLEYKTKRQKKTQALEQKYKDKPKIAFHKLTEEGDRLFTIPMGFDLVAVGILCAAAVALGHGVGVVVLKSFHGRFRGGLG